MEQIKSMKLRWLIQEKLIAAALSVADQDTQFFIATDEQRLLDQATRLFKGRTVIHYDCYRSCNSQPLHMGRHDVSRAQAGEDVVV